MTIKAIRPITDAEQTVYAPGHVCDMSGTLVRACWYNLHTDELVPGDDPPGEDEHDHPSLWWVAGLDD